MQNHRRSLLSLPQPGRFYSLNEEEAHEFDAAQPEGKTYFTALQPGGNAYLLDYDDFDLLLHKDLDPGDAEPGCSLQFSATITNEQRFQICSGLIALGYAVSLYADYLLLVPWQREILLPTIVRDICQIASAFSREQRVEGLFPVASEQALAWLDDADRFIALAQEFFSPLEGKIDETSSPVQPSALLRGAAHRFQAARRFLEEGRSILEMLPRLDLRLLEPRITASCHSDDYVIEVEKFDATLWFMQASDEDIRALQSEAYGGDETADTVAELAASYDMQVQAMFEHNHALSVGTELRGFSCYVDETEAESWLTIHRPHLVQKEDLE